jgi:hypothetical protein
MIRGTSGIPWSLPYECADQLPLVVDGTTTMPLFFGNFALGLAVRLFAGWMARNSLSSISIANNCALSHDWLLHLPAWIHNFILDLGHLHNKRIDSHL